jgi:histidine ammonia-lyase
MIEKELTVTEFNEILFKGKELVLNPESVKKVEKNHSFLKDFSRHKLIYGINTGFGPMAQ